MSWSFHNIKNAFAFFYFALLLTIYSRGYKLYIRQIYSIYKNDRINGMCSG